MIRDTQSITRARGSDAVPHTLDEPEFGGAPDDFPPSFAVFLAAKAAYLARTRVDAERRRGDQGPGLATPKGI